MRDREKERDEKREEKRGVCVRDREKERDERREERCVRERKRKKRTLLYSGYSSIALH